MEEILLRFSHIGRAVFIELNGKDFGKSREVNRDWYHFINNERALQKVNKIRIQEKIQTLTEEAFGKNKHHFTSLQKEATNQFVRKLWKILMTRTPKIGVDGLHFIKQLRMVTCQFVSSLLKMLLTKIQKIILDGLHFIKLLRMVICQFASSLLNMLMTRIPKVTVEGLHFMRLLRKVTCLFINSLLKMLMTKIPKIPLHSTRMGYKKYFPRSSLTMNLTSHDHHF